MLLVFKLLWGGGALVFVPFKRQKGAFDKKVRWREFESIFLAFGVVLYMLASWYYLRAWMYLAKDFPETSGRASAPESYEASFIPPSPLNLGRTTMDSGPLHTG